MGIWLDFTSRGLQVFRIRATALNLFKWATSTVSGSIFTIFIIRFKMWIKKLFTFWQIIVWILKVCASRQTNIVSPKLNLKSVSINLNCKYLDHRDHLIKSIFFFRIKPTEESRRDMRFYGFLFSKEFTVWTWTPWLLVRYNLMEYLFNLKLCINVCQPHYKCIKWIWDNYWSQKFHSYRDKRNPVTSRTKA